MATSFIRQGLEQGQKVVYIVDAPAAEDILNDFFTKSKCIAMCQYDKCKFKPGVLLDILATHPLAVIGTEVFENLYYIPPEDFLGPHPEEAKLNKWLCRLSERSRSEKTLRASEEKYRLLVNNLPGIVYKGFKDFSVEFFDNKIEALTGYPLDEFNSGRLKWSDLIVQADLKASRECFIRALKK